MTNELEERNKKRKAKRRRKKLLSFLGFILLLIYIPAIWKWLFSVNHEIGVIRTATLEVKAPIEGVLIRKEMLLKSPGTGIIIPTIQNGERVAKDKEVASYIQSNMKDVAESYRQMEIDILKRVVAEFDSTTGSQREFWESAIETQIKGLSDLSNTGHLSDAEDIRNHVDRVLEARARYILDSSSTNDKLKNEKQELERLRSNIKKSVQSVFSPNSGIISYKWDGLEEVFTGDKRYNITVEDIRKTIEDSGSMEKSLTPAEINAKENEPFAKLISNEEAWITFHIPEKQGKAVTLLFEKAKMKDVEVVFELELEGLNERIPIVMEQIDENSDEVYKIIARMNKMIEKTMDFRGVKGNLVINSVTGMKVPLRSLFNLNTVDDTADICIINMDKAKFVRIQIVARQDSYAIIENIDTTDIQNSVNIFDVYLVNPNNIAEGQVIER